MSAIEQFLQEKLVRELILCKSAPKEIIYVTTNSSITATFELLAKHDILAVPVREQDELLYVGWISVLDILSFILRVYSKGETIDKDAPWSTWCKNIDTLICRGEELGKISVVDAMDKTWISPVNATGSVFELVESLFATSKNIHRIGVCNDENDNYVRAIVTQSDVIQLLYKYSLEKPFLGNIADTPIGDIPGLRYHAESNNLISMSINAQTIHAFWLMIFDKVHGIPIVDRNGILIANLSASDIKGISRGNLPFSSLLYPIREFIQKGCLKPPIKCTWRTSFMNLIQQLALFRVHRVWIVDADDKLEGVITLTTIMKFISDLGK